MRRPAERACTILLLGLLTGLLAGGCTAPTEPSDATNEEKEDGLYQVGTLSALLQGAFVGSHVVGDLTQRGTLGLGTVNRLDGEMVVVDGTVYAVRDDGTTEALDASTGTPFGVVTPFEVDTTIVLREVDSFAAFQAQLDERLPRADPMCAFRVAGTFDSLQTRSVSPQQPPFPELSEVIANQTRFAFADVEGTMVGFRIPAPFDGVNAVGYHAHFLTAGREGGGHVLGLRSSALTVEVDRVSSLRVDLQGR